MELKHLSEDQKSRLRKVQESIMDTTDQSYEDLEQAIRQFKNPEAEITWWETATERLNRTHPKGTNPQERKRVMGKIMFELGPSENQVDAPPHNKGISERVEELLAEEFVKIAATSLHQKNFTQQKTTVLPFAADNGFITEVSPTDGENLFLVTAPFKVGIDLHLSEDLPEAAVVLEPSTKTIDGTKVWKATFHQKTYRKTHESMMAELDPENTPKRQIGITMNLQQLERESPEFWKMLEALYLPRRILPPNGYPSPKHFAWMLHSGNMNAQGDLRALKGKPEAESGTVAWTAYAQSQMAVQWINGEAPIYFLEKNTLDLLRNTKVPEGFSPDEWKLPMPTFGVVLPAEEKFPLLIVSSHQAEEPFPTLKPEKAKLADVTIRSNDPSVHSLRDTFRFDGTKPKWPPKLLLSTGNLQGEHLLSWFNMEHDADKLIEGSKENTRMADQIDLLKILLNLMCWFKYRQPQIKNSLPAPEISHKNKKSGIVFWKPILLREPGVVQTPTPAGTKTKKDGEETTHASPRTHWRRGHWHTILFGEKRSQRERRWFLPTMVNAKDE